MGRKKAADGFPAALVAFTVMGASTARSSRGVKKATSPYGSSVHRYGSMA